MSTYNVDAVADPTTAAFWRACGEHRLTVQRCGACGHHQFYPRPFCLACESKDLAWVEVSGKGTIYSLTTVRVQVQPDLPPPYKVAIVQLDEGPRLLTNITDETAQIGQKVSIAWRHRDPLPPLPVFSVVG